MEQRRVQFIALFTAVHFTVAFMVTLFGLFADTAGHTAVVVLNFPTVVPVLGILALFSHYDLMFPGLLCVLPFAIFGAMALNSRLWAHLAWHLLVCLRPHLGARQRVEF